MLNDYLKSPRDVRLELAERAKAERLRQNLTQEALAHAAGISLSTLRRFEKTGDIALASFVEIAFALRRMDGFDALFPEPPVHSLLKPRPANASARGGPMRLEVYLNARGERRFVGLLEERSGDILFEYDKRFLDSGIELSPFLLPCGPGWRPIRNGHSTGCSASSTTACPTAGAAPAGPPAAAQRPAAGTDHALSRLSLVGSGGMGALEYEPVTRTPTRCPNASIWTAWPKRRGAPSMRTRCPWRRCARSWP
ncbi:MAG: helix-turn-helix domain-containing protein [Bilophila wadsworthia]